MRKCGNEEMEWKWSSEPGKTCAVCSRSARQMLSLVAEHTDDHNS